jgi:hypothetical protein
MTMLWMIPVTRHNSEESQLSLLPKGAQSVLLPRRTPARMLLTSVHTRGKQWRIK